ncbi:hypothetical protein [Burkholderia cenocepacia]|uniref:hypothetical protein n=1 Tax=Burkholderia cenocepacia TaxID=95486 RepID=UPI000F5A84AA|nr:hypothetical protein [Burkholderia cenocepacia]
MKINLRIGMWMVYGLVGLLVSGTVGVEIAEARKVCSQFDGSCYGGPPNITYSEPGGTKHDYAKCEAQIPAYEPWRSTRVQECADEAANTRRFAPLNLSHGEHVKLMEAIYEMQNQ